MDKTVFKRLLKKKRIYLFIIGVILIGIVPIPLRGVQLGMDFRGGTMIDIRLDETVDPMTMNTITQVLKDRVDAYGLRDVSVTPQGDSHVRIEVAETDSEALERLKSIIGQQGSFETLYDGEVVLHGKDVEDVITDPQKGYGAKGSPEAGYRWSVPFRVTMESARDFAEAVEGECTPIGNSQCQELLYMFIDRPEDALIIMNDDLYEEEGEISQSLEKEEIPAAGSASKLDIEEIVKNSGVELIVTNEIDQETLNKTGNRTVIIPENMFNPEDIHNAEEVREVAIPTESYWIIRALKIENIVHLTEGITRGDPVTTPSITGGAETEEESFQEIERISILLRSGRLPVGVTIEREDRVSPLLGERFLNYSILAGIAALLAVSMVVSIRYKRKKIIVPLLMTSFSEVLMTLGAAALIGWQLDLPAIAGIIAVVGTGVDHQVIMTDEAISKKDKEEESLARKIKKAFSIIFRSSMTTIFAMFPLLFMGLGALQGFAIVTIIGSLIGVTISRPAYGAIINEIL